MVQAADLALDMWVQVVLCGGAACAERQIVAPRRSTFALLAP